MGTVLPHVLVLALIFADTACPFHIFQTPLTSLVVAVSRRGSVPKLSRTSLSCDLRTAMSLRNSKETTLAGLELPLKASDDPVTSAYVHIPFCQQRCYYCDFPVSVVGRSGSGAAQSKIEAYVDSLMQELQHGGAGAMHSFQAGSHANLKTIFIGGGTPSLLQPAQVSRILDALEKRFGIAAGAEISMEMDPGTFDLNKAKAFKEMGVTRASMGVQSFNEELLKNAGRGHSVEDAMKSFGVLESAGFREISMDLMSGLPGQTLEVFRHSLDKAISFGPSHLSVYDLIVEEGTAFGRWYGPMGFSPKGLSVQDLPEEDLSAQMYRMADKVLGQAGYEHYEISNYARRDAAVSLDDDASPHRSRHNCVYWQYRPFLAFGMGATSYIGGKRLRRPRTLPEYHQWIKEGGKESGLVGEDAEEMEEEEDAQDQLAEAMMVGLRMRDGLCTRDLRQRYGDGPVDKVMRALQKHVKSGLLEVTEGSLSRVRLTVPEGFLFSNSVLVTLFEV